MEKKTLYPKTRRVNLKNNIVITEKLDGSNIGFFKVNGELLIAQRNLVFTQEELKKEISYKGLQGWLNEHGQNLRDRLVEGSRIFWRMDWNG